MTTLTFDDMARAGNLFGPLSSGIQIRPSHYWPKVEDGTETLRFEAHPFIKWLSQWLPIDPYVEMELMKYRDADLMYDKRSGAIYCSYAQADAIRRRAAS